MAGLGGPGLGGGFGKKNSIGSKVGRALGGHLSKAGKLGGSGKKGFNFSGFNFGNFFKSLKPGYANNMGQVTGKLNQLNQPSAWKVKQFADKNLDITKMNKSFLVNIDTNRAIQGIKNETVRNWLNKYTPKSVKDLRINHQMYSPTKIKPTDPRYNPTGTGSIQLDPDVEEYLEWMARTNPEGHTISDWEKLYAKQIKEGISLKDAMKYNPAETLSYYALIDDTIKANNEKLKVEAQQKAEEKALDTQYKNDQAIYNNNKNNMTVKISPSTGGGSGPQQQQTDEQWLQDQYMSKFGRSADTKTKGGASYWLDQMAKNPTTHSRDEVARMLGASAEAKSFAKDGVVRPGGVRRDQSVYSQGVAGQEYAKHFQPGGALAGLNSADTLNQIAANTYKSMPEIPEGGDGQLQVMPGVDGGYFQFADEDVVAQPTLPGAPKVPGTDGWWNQFADADAFKKFLNEGKEPAKSDGMGDFMKFMMLMNVMRPGGGGWGGGGGSQFGYGGLNPGGVQAAYDPMKSLQSMGTWFKDNFGSGGTTTGTVNTN